MITAASRSAELDEMLATLEAQYEAHTERLTHLIACRGRRRSAVRSLAEIAEARQALAETARLLQRMADRDFGTCCHCRREIPIEWLRGRLDTRTCPRCMAVPA